MVESLVAAAEALKALGPYFLVVVIGYAYWKREAYVKELHQQNLALSKEHVETTAAMTNAITHLKDAVASLKDLLHTFLKKP